MKIKRRHFFPLIWFGIILYASLTPSDKIPKFNLFEHFDKVVHFSIYLGLSFLTIPAILKNYNYKKAFIQSAIFSITVGIGFEIIQSQLTQTREGSVLDVLANTIGALLGVFFYQLIIRNKRIENLIFKIE